MRCNLIFCLAVAAMLTPPALGGNIYTPHERHTRLGTISPATGAGTDVGSFEQPGLRLASGVFDNQGDYYSFALMAGNTDSQLARVDIATGEATLIGSPAGGFVLPLEVDANDTMYTVRHVAPDAGIGGDPELFTVDKSDGQISLVGNTGVERAMDLAFDADGTLWIVGGDEGGNKLYTLDPLTGASTFRTEITGVVEVTQPRVEIMGIMFDEHDTLYGTAFLPGPDPNDFLSPLFTIDTATGLATKVGDTGFRLPHGGDYLVPEPATGSLLLAFVAAGVAVPGVRRGRRS